MGIQRIKDIEFTVWLGADRGDISTQSVNDYDGEIYRELWELTERHPSECGQGGQEEEWIRGY